MITTCVGIALLLMACKDASDAPDSPWATDSAKDSPIEDSTPLDEDGDGWPAGEGDCNDQDPTIHDGATEVADGVDQDCDGLVDEGTEAYDDDRDGIAELDGDCDDADPTVWPGAEDLFPCDGIDQSCMGLVEPCDSPNDAYAIWTHVGAFAVVGDVDMTGDGQADLLTATGSLFVWEIPAEGGQFDDDDWVALLNSSDYTNDGQLCALGDTDGDGFMEIVHGNFRTGRAWVNILAAPVVGESEADQEAMATLSGDDGSSFGQYLDAGWDASGDGVADILIGAPFEGESVGAVYLVSGDVRGEVAVQDAALARIQGDADGDYLGQGLRFSGDNDGDGVADVLLGRWGQEEIPSRVSWFAGPLAGSMTMADGDLVLDDPTRALMPWYFTSPGDWDGDGTSDVILSAFDACASYLYLFSGVPTAGLATAVARIDGQNRCVETGAVEDAFGSKVLMADVNGDGFDDLVVGAVTSSLGGSWVDPRASLALGSGAVAVFVGPFAGARGFWEAERIWAGANAGAELGYDLATAGDFDGDGREDFVMTGPTTGDTRGGLNTMDGAVYLMLGSADW